MTIRNEQRFYSRLRDTFVGENIKGDSGYVNLMNLRSKYFEDIKPHIKNSIEEKIEEGARDELFEKLYTFFDSYLNETGTVFFSNTQLHRNLYERVYSDRQDVSLFWKTKNLYYVKTEALYDDLETEIEGITFQFKASSIRHQKGNEKKTLVFHLTGVDEKTLQFNVKYDENNSYERCRDYLDIEGGSNEILDYIYENFEDIEHPQIDVISNDLDYKVFTKTEFKSIISVYDLNDTVQSTVIEFSPYKNEHLLKYFSEIDIPIAEDLLIKAFRIYKKQNEVDYFVHKDAEGFLKEQFNIYLFNYLFQDEVSQFSEDRVKQIQGLKEIAREIIEYIAKFENELKSIWNKPKFVLESNYLFTLDRLSDNLDLVEKIINHPGFDSQIDEYKYLEEEWVNQDGETEKKRWKDFEIAADLNKEDIIIEKENEYQLNSSYEFLPIDTKYFPDLKWEILGTVKNLENAIDGYLVKSDNYQALNTLLPKFKEKITLIYIDPPFNTGDDFLYKDKFQDSTWLTLMRNRMEIAYELLNENGSHYLHLDENANYYGRLLCDNIFGEDRFKREIVWDIQVLSGYKVRVADTNWILGHQTILFHTKSDSYKFNKLMQPHTLKYLESFTQTDEDGRKYQVAHGRRIYRDEIEDKGKPFGDVWPDIKDILDIERPFPDVWKELVATINLDRPQRDVWGDIKSFQQQPTSSERILFDTQKPEKLMERIIRSGSDKGDYVLDYFGGSGTTAATALKLNRKFITCEMGEHFDNILIPRMKRTMFGHETSVSRDNNYQGGGLIKYYRLEQYEETLAKSKYEKNGDELKSYTFASEQKMLDAIDIDYEDEVARIHFEELYPNVDIAETLSNLTGKTIQEVGQEKVVFEDGEEIVFSEMTFGDYPWIKPLLWWNSDGESLNE